MPACLVIIALSDITHIAYSSYPKVASKLSSFKSTYGQNQQQAKEDEQDIHRGSCLSLSFSLFSHPLVYFVFSAPSIMPTTTTDTLSLVTTTVTVAPLVLLSVADHYGRSAKGTRKRVVGVLLGQNDGKTVRVSNSFAGVY